VPDDIDDAVRQAFEGGDSINKNKYLQNLSDEDLPEINADHNDTGSSGFNMSIKVNKNWWKYIFDEVYLQTDARSVCNDELTFIEVNFLEESLDYKKSSPILDLCGGQGRHALELSRRGFTKVITLDYSGFLVSLGKKRARQEDLNTIFIQGDARHTGFRGQTFQSIIIMGSSFGYFVQEEENQKILNEAFRLLLPKGILLLDIPNRDYVLRKFKPFASHKIRSDIEVSRYRALGHNIIYCREKVIAARKGLIRENTYCTRLYSTKKISALLNAAGFLKITFQKDFLSRETEGDYGTMTKRMIVKAEK
jgi:D-alanine-D-alanine ligase